MTLGGGGGGPEPGTYIYIYIYCIYIYIDLIISDMYLRTMKPNLRICIGVDPYLLIYVSFIIFLHI